MACRLRSLRPSTTSAFTSMVGGSSLQASGAPAGRRSWSAIAPKHALQERGGLDQLAGARQAGGFANYVLIQHRLHLVLSARAALTAGLA